MAREGSSDRFGRGMAGHAVGLSAALLVLAAASSATAQEEMHRRDRGSDYYNCVSANTPGAGDVWVGVRAVGHIWDDPTDASGNTTKRLLIFDRNMRAFPEVCGEVGIYDLAAFTVESRVLSWAYKFGWLSAAAKLTWPNNKELRLHGPGLEIKYIYNSIETTPTLGGYVGFMPEGPVVKGSTLQCKALYDLDFISVASWLPVKLSTNYGIRVPLRSDRTSWSQSLVSVAVAYAGLDVDVFVEYSFEGFVNNSVKPKIFHQDARTFEVAFSENPMYLTPGGKFRYPNGITLYACVPLLLSVNQGSDMTYGGNHQRLWDDFPDEQARGITDPFDPWYVKWKVVAGITIPLRYTQTSAEMMRNFLLMKNRPQRKRIDIDEKLKAIQGPGTQQKSDEEDKKARLEEIKKRREQSQ
jgi:hypothetical protein